MSHDSNLRRAAFAANRKARLAKLASKEAACVRADMERQAHDSRIVADWQARFNSARNAACAA